MNRWDDYGLNKNELYIYRMAKTILQEQEIYTVKDITDVMDEAINLGKWRRIDDDYNYNLVKNRLCNFFDMKSKKIKLTITKNNHNDTWYYDYCIRLNGKYAGFIGKIYKNSKWLNVCCDKFNINTSCGNFKTIKEVRDYIKQRL